MVASTQTAVLTTRVNGVSQGTLAITIGTTTTVVKVDVATPVRVVRTDLLSLLFVTGGGADAGNTRPRCSLVGDMLASF
jgi:hypothetical protein